MISSLVFIVTHVHAIPVAAVATGRGGQRQRSAKLRGNVAASVNTSLVVNANATSEFDMQFARAINKVQCNIVELYGPEPAVCTTGKDFITTAQLQDQIKLFSATWAMQKRILPAHCCMGINHMFALFSLVKTLKPAAIIESGVAAGHQTFMLRMAANPYIPMYAIDPGDPSVNYKFQFGYWKDMSGFTKYFTGSKFVDFADINWGEVIPDEEMRRNTLVILDDHQSCVERFRVMQMWGFKWAFYEDNYPRYVATSNDEHTCKKMDIKRDFPFKDFLYGDAYSPNAACGEKVDGSSKEQFLYKDKFGGECEYIDAAKHNGLAAFLQKNMETYYEFPALYSDCKIKRPTILHQNEHGLAYLRAFGFPEVKDDIWNYGHLFPAFIELKVPGYPLDMFINQAGSPIWSIAGEATAVKQMGTGASVPIAEHLNLTASKSTAGEATTAKREEPNTTKTEMTTQTSKPDQKKAPEDGSSLGGGNANSTNRLVGAWKAVGSWNALPVKKL